MNPDYIRCSFQTAPNKTSNGIFELLEGDSGRKYIVAVILNTIPKPHSLIYYLDDDRIEMIDDGSVARYHYKDILLLQEIQAVLND